MRTRFQYFQETISGFQISLTAPHYGILLVRVLSFFAFPHKPLTSLPPISLTSAFSLAESFSVDCLSGILLSLPNAQFFLQRSEIGTTRKHAPYNHENRLQHTRNRCNFPWNTCPEICRGYFKGLYDPSQKTRCTYSEDLLQGSSETFCGDKWKYVAGTSQKHTVDALKYTA